ncbi:MAG: HAD family phosphatase [Bacteroidota bacterium]|jgi:HAD superfamily hydrolase (TIGR01509 family)
MRQISTVLFDLGNVLAYINFSAFWRDLGFLRAEEIVPYRDGYTSLTLQYETGYISTDDYLNGLRSVFNDKFTIVQLEQAFSCIIQQPVKGVIDIVKHVSIIHQTALVSNTNEIHYRLSLTKFEALKILRKHYLSYQLRVMKPAPGFYDAIIKDQGILPSKMLFIDDIAENLKAAKNAGMHAVRFENSEQLETDLQNLGIL